MKEEGEKRFALLQACKDSDYVKKRYGGYFNVFFDAYGEEGQRWDLYRVVDGEFPETEELEKYEGFVITGSAFDAHGNELWILRLCLLLRTLNAMQKKVLGICFGLQILCRALGGKTGRAIGGWDIGIKEVRMVEDLDSHPLFSGLEISKVVTIIKIHQNVALEMPLDAGLLARSDQTSIEMFSIGDHILAIQGHPEYTMDILFNLVERLRNQNEIESDFVEDLKARLESAEPEREVWKKICKNFLNRRLTRESSKFIMVEDV